MQTNPACFLQLLSRNTGSSSFLSPSSASPLQTSADSPDPMQMGPVEHMSLYSAVSAALRTGKWCCSLCECSNPLLVEPGVTVQWNVRAAGVTAALLTRLTVYINMCLLGAEVQTEVNTATKHKNSSIWFWCFVSRFASPPLIPDQFMAVYCLYLETGS